MSDQPKGVVIEEIPVAAEKTVPTLAELKDAGLSQPEIKMAERLKIIEPDKKDEPPAKAEEKKADEVVAPAPEVQDAFNDPEKEATLLETFNKNEKGLYHKMKKENFKRQAAEADRDQVALKLKVAEERAARLEAEAKTRAEAPPAKEEAEKLDIFGNPIKEEKKADEKDAPVTKKDLEDRDKAEAEKQKKAAEAEADRRGRAEKLVIVLNAQEADAKARYSDFDHGMELAVDIMKNANGLDKIFTDKRQASRAMKLLIDFNHASANADKFKDGDYNAADIAYELGQMHPKFSQANGGGKTTDRNGDLDPEAAKKIVQNSGRRGSSASISNGGGKKFVPYEEMTAEQLAALPTDEFRRVPREIRRRIMADF
jgi:hypothetical protein